MRAAVIIPSAHLGSIVVTAHDASVMFDRKVAKIDRAWSVVATHRSLEQEHLPRRIKL